MINSTRVVVVTCIVFTGSIRIATAQLNLSKWQVGVNAGIFIYQGDLTPSPVGSYRTATPNIGVYVSRILNPYFAIRANASFGSLKGDEGSYSKPSWRKLRGLNFSTPVTELTGLLVWNPFGNNNNEIGATINNHNSQSQKHYEGQISTKTRKKIITSVLFLKQ